MKKITKITAEQEAQLPTLVERWVGYASEQSSLADITSAVTEIYRLMGKPAPVVLLSQSPLAALYTAAALKMASGEAASLDSTLGSTLYSTLGSTLGSTLDSTLYSTLDSTLDSTLRSTLGSTLRSTLGSTLRSTLDSTLGSTLYSTLRSTLYSTLGSTLDNSSDEKAKQALNWARGGGYMVMWWGFWAGYYEFAKSIGVEFNEEYYAAFTSFVRRVPYIVALDGVAIVSKIPSKIKWHDVPVEADSRISAKNMPKNRTLTGDGEMAVEFEDGFGAYAMDGRILPEKYGKTKRSEWKAPWLLEEQNAELRMILIKGIGYERIFHELKAKKIHSWREYNLHRIEGVDVEPIHLNTMTCPSTGKIHVHRVPPEIVDAREAITWSNHGVDPESFVVEH